MGRQSLGRVHRELAVGEIGGDVVARGGLVALRKPAPETGHASLPARGRIAPSAFVIHYDGEW